MEITPGRAVGEYGMLLYCSGSELLILGLYSIYDLVGSRAIEENSICQWRGQDLPGVGAQNDVDITSFTRRK